MVLRKDEEKVILKFMKLVALFRKMDNKHLPNDQKRERVGPISLLQYFLNLVLVLEVYLFAF